MEKEIATMDAKTMIDDARLYREQETLVGKGGVVVFFQGEISRLGKPTAQP